MMIYKYYFKMQNSCNGVVLIELLIVFMILGLLVVGAVSTWDMTIKKTRFNQTAKEMDQLVYAIAGNPALYSEGRRTDFGYIGDMGRLPDSLGNLVTAPAGTTNWHGPYIKGKFKSNPNDYLEDAWGDDYIYSRESLFIRSYGGGTNLTPSSWITRKIANDTIGLYRNTVSGQVLDLLGIPPPYPKNESVQVYITYPINGNLWTPSWGAGATPNTAGNFYIYNIPAGEHRIVCIYDTTATPDTTDFVEKSVCVYPGRTATVEFRMTREF
jgi:type II secretory pathway pseudopilin PulG